MALLLALGCLMVKGRQMKNVYFILQPLAERSMSFCKVILC